MPKHLSNNLSSLVNVPTPCSISNDPLTQTLTDIGLPPPPRCTINFGLYTNDKAKMIDHATGDCNICPRVAEIPNHIFFQSRFSFSTWTQIQNLILDATSKTTWATNTSLLDILDFCLLPSSLNSIWLAILYTILWTLWNAYNESKYQGIVCSFSGILTLTKALHQLQVVLASAKGKNKRCKVHQAIVGLDNFITLLGHNLLLYPSALWLPKYPRIIIDSFLSPSYLQQIPPMHLDLTYPKRRLSTLLSSPKRLSLSLPIMCNLHTLHNQCRALLALYSTLITI